MTSIAATIGVGVAVALVWMRPAVPDRIHRLGTVGTRAAVADPNSHTHRWSRLRPLRRQGSASRQRSIETELPELVDLIALAVAAGLTVPESLKAAAPCAPPALRGDVSDAVAAIATGARIETTLLQLGGGWGEPGRPLVHALVDHTRYGTPLVPSLERVGAEARTRRRRAAETRARRLPVLLLFPLVLCTLPAFGLLTVAPLVAGTLGSLDGSPLEAPSSTPP